MDSMDAQSAFTMYTLDVAFQWRLAMWTFNGNFQWRLTTLDLNGKLQRGPQWRFFRPSSLQLTCTANKQSLFNSVTRLIQSPEVFELQQLEVHGRQSKLQVI